MLIAKILITTQERDVTTRRLRHCIVTSHDNQSQLEYVTLHYVNVITSKEMGTKCCSCVSSLHISSSWKLHFNLSSELRLELLFAPEFSDMQTTSLCKLNGCTVHQ